MFWQARQGWVSCRAAVDAAAAAASHTTWNPSDKSASVTLSNGNLTAAGTSSSDVGVRSVAAKTSGKFYVEYTVGSNWPTGPDDGVGIALSSASLTTLGTNATGAFITFKSGTIWFNGSSIPGKVIGTASISDVICMAIDFTNQRGWFRRNAGNWLGDAAADPATNTNGIDISALFPGAGTNCAACFNLNGATITGNFGDSSFAQSVPSGFTSGWPV